MALKKVVLEGVAGDANRDDGGQAYVVELDYFTSSAEGEDISGLMAADLSADPDNGFFVRLQSWHEGAKSLSDHPTVMALAGNKLRITIEVLDEEPTP